ncbi:MAG: hypothetical protein AABX29_01355 [Nanoarchaeota archaeon]
MSLKIVFKKPYLYGIVLIFLAYIFINIWLSGFYNTIKLIIIYASTINWLELFISIILTLTIGILVSVNSVYAYIKYKERKKCLKESAVATAGSIGGLIIGVCPLCVTGLFPLIFSFLGIGFSFASLPFKGIEVQILVIIILLISLFMLNKK